MPREALEGSLGLQPALKMCDSALQLPVGVSELWFRIGGISSNYYLLQLFVVPICNGHRKKVLRGGYQPLHHAHLIVSILNYLEGKLNYF